MLSLLALLSSFAFAADCPIGPHSIVTAIGGEVNIDGVAIPVGSPAEIVRFNETLQSCGLSELQAPFNAWRRNAELTKSGLIWLWPMVPVTFTLQNIHRARFAYALGQATAGQSVARAE